MAFSVEYIYRVHDRFSKNLTKYKKQTDEVKRKMKSVSVQAKRMGESFQKAGKSLTLRATAPIMLVGGMALKSAADLERMEVSFKSMLGGGEQAGKMMKDLTSFTARTPFRLEGVGTAAKQLLGFGVPVEKMQDRLGMLGDISAGAGIPLTDMASIFGKIKAKGKAMTEEIMQMSDRGIPIIDRLAKGFGVPKDAIFEMASKGKISFEVIDQALRKLTGKSGIYHKQMEEQSKTLWGVLSTLGDNINLLMGDIGNIIEKTFNIKEAGVNIIDFIDTIRKSIASFSQTHPILMKSIVIFTGVVAILGPIIAGLGFMVTGVIMAATAFKALTLAMMVNPIGLIITAVIALTVGLVYLYERVGSVRGVFSALGDIIMLGFAPAIITAIDAVVWLIEVMAKIPGTGDIFDDAIKGLKELKKEMSQPGPATIGEVIQETKRTFQRGQREETKKMRRGGAWRAAEYISENQSRREQAQERRLLAQQNVNITGEIGVRADQGSSVTSNTIALNAGKNMPYAGAH